jgi:hypothetical protein
VNIDDVPVDILNQVVMATGAIDGKNCQTGLSRLPPVQDSRMM